MHTKFNIDEHERLLLIKNKQPVQFLTAGQYRFFNFSFDQSFVLDTDHNTFAKTMELGSSIGISKVRIERLAKQALIAQALTEVSLSKYEVGLIYKDDKLVEILSPSAVHFVWNRTDLRIEIIDVEQAHNLPDHVLAAVTDEFQKVIGSSGLCHVWQTMPGFNALIYIDDQLVDMTTSKKFGLWSVNRKVNVVMLDTRELIKADHAIKNDWLSVNSVNKCITQRETGGDEVGLLFRDRKLFKVVSPNSEVLFWHNRCDWKFEVINIAENFEVSTSLMNKLNQQNLVDNTVMAKMVDQDYNALLIENGKVSRKLTNGLQAFWTFNRNLEIKMFDKRWINIDVAGQEILTKDRVSIRINLNGNFKVVDPLLVMQSVKDYQDHVYKVLQLALREIVGSKTLDELLQDKEAVNQQLISINSRKFNDIGITLGDIGIKDIILPGDMKEILNQVVNAQKTAEANNIKRREETAQTRSLHNTAKVMEGNETLMRLKELETLEKISQSVGELNVYGGLKEVMKNLV